MQKIFLLMMFLVLSQITGCTHLPRVYWGADKMHGKVIDAETKEPVKDAVVVAIWQLEGGWFQPEYTANIALLETTTDEEGNFKLDAWGPRFTMSGWMDNNSPLLITYKKGYLFGWLNIWRDMPEWLHPTNIPPEFYITDFITVEIKKYQALARNYPSELPDMYKYIGRYGPDSYRRHCDWLEVPVFTSRMIEVGRLNIDSLLGSGECGVNKEYMLNMIKRYGHEK